MTGVRDSRGPGAGRMGGGGAATPLPGGARPWRGGLRAAGLGLLALLGTACTGSTFRSGVGDALLERPPYYAGARPAAEATAVVRLPIAYQRGAAQAPIFDPEGGEGTAVAALIAEMEAYLDSLDGAPRRLAAPTPPGTPPGTPPDVLFGCQTEGTDECVGETLPGERAPRMRLAVGRPSGSWATWAGSALAGEQAEHLLLITLEVGQYWPRQTNWRGSKAIDLGTRHTVELPWLTALDAPISVVQLTGALVAPDGRAVRVGAEGLLAKRTGIVLSGFGVQALISDQDVEQLRSARREDLPGSPLVWQAALRTLVSELTGRRDLAVR